MDLADRLDCCEPKKRCLSAACPFLHQVREQGFSVACSWALHPLVDQALVVDESRRAKRSLNVARCTPPRGQSKHVRHVSVGSSEGTIPSCRSVSPGVYLKLSTRAGRRTANHISGQPVCRNPELEINAATASIPQR
jgi:hypothetical protein